MINWLPLMFVFVATIIAMICRALVHTLLHHYGSFSSKFNVRNHRWWNPEISWLNKYELNDDNSIKLDENDKPIKKKGVIIQLSDAFHFFNTIELGAFTFTIATPVWMLLGLAWWWLIIIYGIIGLIIILTFNLFYDKIWR